LATETKGISAIAFCEGRTGARYYDVQAPEDSTAPAEQAATSKPRRPRRDGQRLAIPWVCFSLIAWLPALRAAHGDPFTAA